MYIYIINQNNVRNKTPRKVYIRPKKQYKYLRLGGGGGGAKVSEDER